MFSLDGAFLKPTNYLEEKDIVWHALSLALGVFIVVELARSQVPEIDVLQLIPGFYLVLLFLSWIFLVFFSILLQRIPFQIDIKKSYGTKTFYRFQIGPISKASIFIAFFQILINLNIVIPTGFDSFNSYGEKTLENIWSFDDVISLEIYFLEAIFFLSQIPIVLSLDPTLEEEALDLPGIWKLIGIICFILGGVVTPTIDANTQISFAGSTFYLYLLFLSIVAKRLNLKYREGVIFG